MALLANAQMTAAAPGTGVVTLSAATLGAQSFAAAGAADGASYSYRIEDGAGGWEIGLGTYTASGAKLARSAVLASSNGNAAVNFTAAVVVSQVVLPADLIDYTNGTARISSAAAADASLLLNKGAAGRNAVLYGQTAGVSRWGMSFGDGAAETGSNAGSNFLIYRYGDTGSYLDAPLTIARATGAVSIANALTVGGAISATGAATFGATLSVTGAISGARLTVAAAAGADAIGFLNKPASSRNAVLYGQTAGVSRWGLSLADGTAESATSTGSNFTLFRYDNTGAYLDAPLSVERATGNLLVTRQVLPTVDNYTALGNTSFRFAQLYAGTSTINTSDAREKTAVAPLTAAELEWSRDLAGEVGTYRFLVAVARKGQDARLHAGLTVQRAIELGRARGLDPMAYGFICHDAWDATPERPAMVLEPAEFDEAGALVRAEVCAPAVPAVPAGDRYGFRVEELTLFILRGLSARVDAIEGRAAA